MNILLNFKQSFINIFDSTKWKERNLKLRARREKSKMLLNLTLTGVFSMIKPYKIVKHKKVNLRGDKQERNREIK